MRAWRGGKLPPRGLGARAGRRTSTGRAFFAQVPVFCGLVDDNILYRLIKEAVFLASRTRSCLNSVRLLNRNRNSYARRVSDRYHKIHRRRSLRARRQRYVNLEVPGFERGSRSGVENNGIRSPDRH